jgi:hypothetical protein
MFILSQPLLTVTTEAPQGVGGSSQEEGTFSCIGPVEKAHELTMCGSECGGLTSRKAEWGQWGAAAF